VFHVDDSTEGDLVIDDFEKPPERLLRLVIHNNMTDIDIRHDKLLNEGQLLDSRFTVAQFLRSDSHADVYLVHDVHGNTCVLHAHVFISGGLPGNWGSFAKRKMMRMRKNCVAEFKFSSRTVIVMETERPIPHTSLAFIWEDEDFPPLPTRSKYHLLTQYNNPGY
jgi:hypothetical protein